MVQSFLLAELCFLIQTHPKCSLRHKYCEFKKRKKVFQVKGASHEEVLDKQIKGNGGKWRYFGSTH